MAALAAWPTVSKPALLAGSSLMYENLIPELSLTPELRLGLS